MYTPVAEINLDALQHNLNVVRQHAPDAKILAMLKANAYGHGLMRVARALNDVDALAVARLDEAILLRQAGIQGPIVLMMGFVDNEELQLLAEYDIQTVVHADYQLDLLAQAVLKQPIVTWLKVETGLNRLGFDADALDTAYQRLKICANVAPPIHLLTHLASAEEPDNPLNALQFQRFQTLTADLDGPKSIAKSAAIFTHPEMAMDWVRPGIMLYGVSPFMNDTGACQGLRPVMTLKSQLISVKQVKQGETIGYDETWRCPEDMAVGIVGFGYGDGYPRHLKADTPVYLHDQHCPIVGLVSMDMLAIDLRACPYAQVGDSVELWGAHLPVEIIARQAHTIAYTLLVGLTSRVHFIEVSDAR